MKQYKVTYGTGYTSAWLFLSEYLSKSQENPPDFKAIVTDSEGVTQEQQKFIESAFKCPVYQTYGLSEVGQIAVQCRKGYYHIVPALCHVEIVDDEGKKLPNGQRVRLYSQILCQVKPQLLDTEPVITGYLKKGNVSVDGIRSI